MAQLLHGDCLEEMKGLDDDSIDFIFCDLPYGQTSCKWDCCIDLEQFWKEIMRIKKLNTPIFMTTTTKFGVSLINSAPKKLKFFDLVWKKSCPTAFLLSKKFPLRSHEMIYAFYEKLPFYDLSSHKHKFIKEEPEKKYVGKPVMRENTTYGDVVSYEIKERKNGESRYEPPLPTTMLEIKSTRGKHSTEKPVALMEWLLKYYSKEGDVVLDPTMGSGSTCIACKNMNRNFIGIEKDDEIFEVACERIWG
tara:strand:- start:57 stop:803 length:747 start_codon:yes stop_codon:yes gene_type:complete